MVDDADYYRDVAYPVLRDVSTWILSRGQFTLRGFEVLAVGGPDESLGKVDNNAFFNVGAKKVLQGTLDCVALLPAGYADPRKVTAWKRALAWFFLPI
eukprot:gene854-biopygen2154